MKDIDRKLIETVSRYRASGIEQQVDYEKFYLYSIVTHSTAIEGSTVTEVENQLLFDEGITAKGSSLAEQLMNVDLKDAYLYGLGWIKKGEPYSVDVLKKLAAKVMQRTGAEYSTLGGNFDSSKGELRRCNVSAGFGGRSYLAYQKVEKATADFCRWLNSELATANRNDLAACYRLSFEAHFRLVTIHPWVDGNGRTTRLLMNMVQRQLGLIPSIVTKEKKGEYIQALIDSREADDSDIVQDVMMAQHIANLEQRILQYQRSIEGTVGETEMPEYRSIKKTEKTSGGLVSEIKDIINQARSNAVRSVDFCRVQMYWNIGCRIFEEEQQGKDRADYGSYLISDLAMKLEPEYGSGFSKRQLERSRQFYRLYPIASAVRTQLNWYQYKLLISIPDKDKREYYQLETINNGWTGRELERQINSMLYERLLLSNNKEAVLAVARQERIPESPTEIIKDPMVLEFLGLERRAAYYEKDLESAIISHVSDFLLELGKGFSFVARQKRILVEDDEFFADLVFYNRLLRCFVVIELKTRKLTHQDLGQLQMYVNYYDRCEKAEDENPTIGILLCTDKNDTAVKLSLPENNKTILAAKYQLYLPTTEQLVREINEVKNSLNKEKEKEE